MNTEQTRRPALDLRPSSRPHPLRNPKAAAAWLPILVPFVITVLANGPAGGLIPHGTYHLVYVAIVLIAIYAVLTWRSSNTSRNARLLMLLIALLQGLAVVGHIGEWASTLSDDRYEEAGIGLVTGNETLHTTFANLTVPALALSILLLIATAVVAASRAHAANARDT